MEDHGVNAAIHATLTALSVAVGRLEEQMKGVRQDILHHTKHDHDEFKEALETVTEIKKDVAQLQSLLDRSKGAWWALAKVGGVVLFIVTVSAGIVGLIRQAFER